MFRLFSVGEVRNDVLLLLLVVDDALLLVFAKDAPGRADFELQLFRSSHHRHFLLIDQIDQI